MTTKSSSNPVVTAAGLALVAWLGAVDLSAATAAGNGCAVAAEAGDCNSNGIYDGCDIAAGTSADCNTNALPDECDVGWPWQVAELVHGDPAAGDRFGQSVAVSGDVAVVGSYLDDAGAINGGSAYVFRRVGGLWQQVAKLTAGADAAGSSQFGCGVAVDGGTIVVGAFGDYETGQNGGAAYIFREVSGTWTRVAKLMADDHEWGDKFGYSVAIRGETTVVGAPGVGADGAAYVFHEIAGTWQQTAKLIDDGIVHYAGAGVGKSVALAYPYIVVGAPDDKIGDELLAGSVAVFRENGGTWTKVARFTADVPDTTDQFGISVAIATGTMVVGNASDKDSGFNSGSAYIYRETANGWVQDAKLIPDDTVAYDYFGQSVATDGTDVLIGAPGDGSFADAVGTVYAFRQDHDHWTPSVEFRTPDSSASRFGSALAVDGSTLVVGAPMTTGACPSCGTAFVFAVPGSWDRNGNAVPDECEVFGDLDSDGVVSLADFVLLSACSWGPQSVAVDVPPVDCAMADFDFDGDIDLVDFAGFQRALHNP